MAKFFERYWFYLVFALVLFAIGAFCLLEIGRANLTPLETRMTGVLLSLIFALAGWLVTHLYSKQEQASAVEEVKTFHEERLKTYALNAVEKVENLSRQMELVTDYVFDAVREEAKQPSSEIVLLEKLKNVQLGLEILKSTNDTFVTDWKGVIGEEIKREEAIEEQIDSLREQLTLEETRRNALEARVTDFEEMDERLSQIGDRELMLRDKIIELEGRKRFPSKPRKQSTKISGEVECSHCHDVFAIVMRAKHRGARNIKCPQCRRYSRVESTEAGVFSSHVLPTIKEQAKCPLCGQNTEVDIPDVTGILVTETCPRCDFTFDVAMGNAGPRISTGGKRVEPTEKFLQLIASNVDDLATSEDQVGRLADEIGTSEHMIRRGIRALQSQEASGVHEVSSGL